jgi:hypothetical protein
MKRTLKDWDRLELAEEIQGSVLVDGEVGANGVETQNFPEISQIEIC